MQRFARKGLMTHCLGIIHRERGRCDMRKVPDGMIAGIAQVNGGRLATRNLTGFRTTGLDLMCPWEFLRAGDEGGLVDRGHIGCPAEIGHLRKSTIGANVGHVADMPGVDVRSGLGNCVWCS